MRVWLINPYGPIPGEGWRDYRFTLIARALAVRGHEVTWWTAAFTHQTKRFRTSGPADECFRIVLVPTPAYRRNIGFGRLWFELQFARLAIQLGRRAPRPDVVIAADPPQFAGWAGRRLAEIHHARLVIDSLDLWPELFVKTSPTPLRPLVRLAVQPLFALRRRNIRAAAVTIAAAEAYRAVAAKVGAMRSITIPIGVDVRAFGPPAVQRQNDRLVAVYAGTLGEAYDLLTVIESFDGVPLDLVIAGHGPAEPRLRDAAARSSQTNVRFIGAVDASELADLYRSADIGLAPYSAASTVAMPVKFFDYLAAGLPIVTSLPADLRGASVQYEAGNAESLRDLLRSLASDRSRLRTLSVAARALASEFDSMVLYEQYANEIEGVAAR